MASGDEVTELQVGDGVSSGITESIAVFVEDLLVHLEQDPEDANFKDTPERVARAWKELLLPDSTVIERVESLVHTAFPSEYGGIVLAQGIRTVSICPHHLLPVEYTIDIGYIPNMQQSMVLGVSKLARIAETMSKRLVLQETLTSDIVEALTILEPAGVVVRISGRHACMRIRGVKQDGVIKTQSITGVFKEDSTVRAELMSLLC